MGTTLERVRGRKNGDQNQRSSECPFILFQKGVPVGLFLKRIEDMRCTRGWATKNKRRCIVPGDAQ